MCIRDSASGAADRLNTTDTLAFDAADWRQVQTISFPMTALTAQPGSRVEVAEVLPVKEILTTPQGDTVLDFGQNLTGWIQFKVRGNAGDQVTLHCFETLDAAGNVYTDNLRTCLLYTSRCV